MLFLPCDIHTEVICNHEHTNLSMHSVPWFYTAGFAGKRSLESLSGLVWQYRVPQFPMVYFIILSPSRDPSIGDTVGQVLVCCSICSHIMSYHPDIFHVNHHQVVAEIISNPIFKRWATAEISASTLCSGCRTAPAHNFPSTYCGYHLWQRWGRSGFRLA